MNVNIAILGAGPHGRQLATLCGTWGVTSTLFDDHLRGYEAVAIGAGRYPWIVGAAWPRVRRSIAESITDAEGPAAFYDGTVFYPGAQIGDDVVVGVHTHVQFNAVISHGCTVGDFVTVCPGVVLAGEVAVKDGVFLGANATVIHGGITIGEGATVGAGAVVIDDVEPFATVAGVPARVL